MLALGLLLALGACRSETVPTVQATPTQPPAPSAVSRPTATAAATATATPTPAPAATPTRRPSPDLPRTVVLPEDDASHPTDVEWWYYNGFLETEGGSEYGFHFVIFEVGGDVVPGVVLMGHLGITDHEAGAFTFGQVLGPKLGAEPANGFRATVGGWTAEGFDGEYRVSGSVEGYSVDLLLSSAKPAVLHGGDGLLDFQEAGESYYYTHSRMDITGSLTAAGATEEVSGSGWMDHQWGDFRAFVVGWDWFSLQLDDEVNGRTELMFFDVWALDGRSLARLGTFVHEDGSVVALGGEDVAVLPRAMWTSPTTGGAYPSGWQMDIEALGLSLVLEPVVEDSEFVPPDPIVPIYWEGEVRVRGERGGEALEGRGFVELVGYARQ